MQRSSSACACGESSAELVADRLWYDVGMSLLEEVFSRCVLSLDERTLVLAGETVVLEMNRDSSSSRLFAPPLTSAEIEPAW